MVRDVGPFGADDIFSRAFPGASAPGCTPAPLGFWPTGLRERLPVVGVPLAAPDPHVELDLQAILDRVYDEAGYGRYIYDESPEPALSQDDATWAATHVPL
ncbi:MAG TPA: DUF4058 family protein [Pirellulales bacterium]|nr:DUF4058 family protein [Pirellulales bacterium]